MASAPLSRPHDVTVYGLIGAELFQGVQNTPQLLFRKLLVDERMALAADIDTAAAHLLGLIAFLEPLIAMTGPGDEMVKGDIKAAAAEGAYFPIDVAYLVYAKTPRACD